SFFRSEVREQRSGNYIANGIDTLFASLLIFINVDESPIDFDLRSLKTQSLRVRHSAHRDEQHLRFKGDDFSFSGLASHTNTSVRLFHFFQLRIYARFDISLAKASFQFFRYFLILEWNE